MLEHLDDDQGWTPDREAVVRRGRQLRRRRRLAIGGLGTLAGVVVAGIAGASYVDRRDGAIDRVDVVTPTPSADGAVNALLVGVDVRSGLPAGRRADTIAVLRLDGDVARVLFVPRDLWDPVSGSRMAQLGSDPQALVDTVDRLLGVPIDHYVELDMPGFVALADAVGGLPVAIDAPIRDERAGLALEPSDCVTLDGEAALALVRSRALEVWDGEGWTADPTGDLGRIARDQALVGIALEQLSSLGADVLALDRLSRVVADHAVVDAGLSLDELVELGRRLADADRVTTEVVPTVPITTEDGAAVLQLADGPVQPPAAAVPIRPCSADGA